MKREKNTKFFKSKLRFENKIDYGSKLIHVVRKSNLTERERDMFYIMFDISKAIEQINDNFFELLRYSDGKYTLIVRRDLNDLVTVTFEINPNYHGIRYE